VFLYYYIVIIFDWYAHYLGTMTGCFVLTDFYVLWKYIFLFCGVIPERRVVIPLNGLTLSSLNFS
jgi:hypothetical protein